MPSSFRLEVTSAYLTRYKEFADGLCRWTTVSCRRKNEKPGSAIDPRHTEPGVSHGSIAFRRAGK